MALFDHYCSLQRKKSHFISKSVPSVCYLALFPCSVRMIKCVMNTSFSLFTGWWYQKLPIKTNNPQTAMLFCYCLFNVISYKFNDFLPWCIFTSSPVITVFFCLDIFNKNQNFDEISRLGTIIKSLTWNFPPQIDRKKKQRAFEK